MPAELQDKINFQNSDSDSDIESDSDKTTDPKLLAELPATTTAAAKKSKKTTKPSKEPKESKRGVVFLGRIPHGFYEHEMASYFSQFGPIIRLRLSRSKKVLFPNQ